MAPRTPPPPLSVSRLAMGVGPGMKLVEIGRLDGLEGLGELSGLEGLGAGGGVVGSGIVGDSVVGGSVVVGGVVGGGVGTNCWHMPKLKFGGSSIPLMMWITPF